LASKAKERNPVAADKTSMTEEIAEKNTGKCLAAGTGAAAADVARVELSAAAADLAAAAAAAAVASSNEAVGSTRTLDVEDVTYYHYFLSSSLLQSLRVSRQQSPTDLALLATNA